MKIYVTGLGVVSGIGLGVAENIASPVSYTHLDVYKRQAPGFIRTEMTEDINENEWKKQIPAGRFGEPEEVADLVSFLVSPRFQSEPDRQVF